MAAPATTDDFIDLVRKSGVVEDKRLDTFVHQLRAGSGMPENPGKLAGVMVQEGLLTHFQAEQLMLGKWRRFTIGKYKVLERLGSGGMGSVYLCEHKFMRRRVAVKVLPAAKAEDQASLERFYREARAAAALDHPNIVRAYDIDQDENLHFLVMEYVDGSSLQEIVKKFGPMNILFACHYIRQAAIGLQHAHEAGLVHRDIKPGNLLVDRTGTVKVLDMGLARFFYDEEDILTKKYDESVLGTADYLAPEQALDSHSVDIRADIYSLGATFYFTLTAQPPFNEGTVAQKLIWHQTRQPKPIRTIRPEVPEAVAVIIDKMMTKDRAKRYQTPAQIVDALAGWTTKPIQPPPEPWMPRLSPAAMVGAEVTISAPTPSPAGVQPLPRPPTATPAPGRAPTPLASPRPVIPQPQPVRQPVAAPPRPAPVPQPVAQQRQAVQPANGAVPEQAPNWGEVASSGPNPVLRRPAPTPAKSSMKVPALRGPSRLQRVLAALKKRPKVLLIAGGVLALLVVAFVIWLGMASGPAGTARQTGTPGSGRKLSVSAAPDKGGEYRTVKDALLKASPGDRIVVLDETIEEPLNLTPFAGKIAANLTIEPDSSLGKRVTWRPPPLQKDVTSAQLLSLANCDGLTVKGFVLHGQNTAHKTLDLVVLYGRCPGLRLEDVQFAGFQRSAVKLLNCTGESGRPITLKNLHVSPPAAAPNPENAALVLEINRSSGVTAMRHVRVEDCLFEGPYRSSVQLVVSDNRELGDVIFQGNRFFKATDGLWYKKPLGKPYPPLGMLFDSNTFFEMERGFHFETMPREDANHQVAIKNNLFVKVKTLAQSGDFVQASADKTFQAEHNVRDAAGAEPPKNISLKSAVQDASKLIQDPAADKAQLLRYPRDANLATAGRDGGPVGAPPKD